MKEIQIDIKYDDQQINAELKTRGFDHNKGMLNSIEIIGILENLKQNEINKLNENE